MSKTLTSKKKVPVTIITGFLGSGKTTLLNYILQSFEIQNVAVLVNEFGDINIDNHFLNLIEEGMIQLTNGCICCTINDNLVDAVLRVMTQPNQIEYLIIETTGIADPMPIALTFLGMQLRDLTHLDAIITVVDAETYRPAEHYHSVAAKHQIFYGDVILLNKTDLVSESRLNKLEAYLYSVKERARILQSQHGQVPLSLILDINQSKIDSNVSEETQLIHQNQHLSNDGFMAVPFHSDRPIALRKFQEFLDYRLPDNVFRAKGVLWFAESSKRHLFQLIGRRFTIEESEWMDVPKNQIVLIGRKLNALFLIQILSNCLA